MRGTSMRNATHPLSSPRRRGPIRRVLAMWHSKRNFESSVTMGPRLRGDDAEWIGRTVILLAALFAWATITLSTSSASADTLRVGKAGREAFSFVPADVGARSGLFKKHNIDLEISSFGGDARIQQAMAADAIDIALGSGPGLAFITKGSPVKGIAAMAGPPLLFALVVRTDDSVKTADDLKGRKVGVSTVGSVTSWIISAHHQRKEQRR